MSGSASDILRPHDAHRLAGVTRVANDLYGWIYAEDETRILGSECRDDLPHKVSAVRAEQ